MKIRTEACINTRCHSTDEVVLLWNLHAITNKDRNKKTFENHSECDIIEISNSDSNLHDFVLLAVLTLDRGTSHHRRGCSGDSAFPSHNWLPEAAIRMCMYECMRVCVCKGTRTQQYLCMRPASQACCLFVSVKWIDKRDKHEMTQWVMGVGWWWCGHNNGEDYRMQNYWCRDAGCWSDMNCEIRCLKSSKQIGRSSQNGREMVGALWNKSAHDTHKVSLTCRHSSYKLRGQGALVSGGADGYVHAGSGNGNWWRMVMVWWTDGEVNNIAIAHWPLGGEGSRLKLMMMSSIIIRGHCKWKSLKLNPYPAADMTWQTTATASSCGHWPQPSQVCVIMTSYYVYAMTHTHTLHTSMPGRRGLG